MSIRWWGIHRLHWVRFQYDNEQGERRDTITVRKETRTWGKGHDIYEMQEYLSPCGFNEHFHQPPLINVISFRISNQLVWVNSRCSNVHGRWAGSIANYIVTLIVVMVMSSHLPSVFSDQSSLAPSPHRVTQRLWIMIQSMHDPILFVLNPVPA